MESSRGANDPRSWLLEFKLLQIITHTQRVCSSFLFNVQRNESISVKTQDAFTQQQEKMETEKYHLDQYFWAVRDRRWAIFSAIRPA